MRQLSYLVLLEKSPRSDWGASVPDLPGCVAVAKTVDAALRRIHIAIEMHLRGLREDGQPLPRPKVRSIRPNLRKGSCEFFATVQVAA
ncbi:MAG: type II toxin-antitoxin system HicB family antitoxin [Planctomycetes bacterium]|nr:type II toxin-antitoxin system HicB family antitoxin [Planctomycetota bacterium]